jgi:hypothetical protein
MAGRLRHDRGMRGSAAAAGTAAAAVEDRQFDAAFRGESGESLLSAVDLPIGREIAAVLA